MSVRTSIWVGRLVGVELYHEHGLGLVVVAGSVGMWDTSLAPAHLS